MIGVLDFKNEFHVLFFADFFKSLTHDNLTPTKCQLAVRFFFLFLYIAIFDCIICHFYNHFYKSRLFRLKTLSLSSSLVGSDT